MSPLTSIEWLVSVIRVRQVLYHRNMSGYYWNISAASSPRPITSHPGDLLLVRVATSSSLIGRSVPPAARDWSILAAGVPETSTKLVKIAQKLRRIC